MIATSSSQTEEIARLKLLLATATERLEQVQAAVFDLRCTTARKEGRGLWVREKDKSGLKAAVWGEDVKEHGELILIQEEDVPAPSLSSLSSFALDLCSELCIVSMPSSPPSFTKYLPPELLCQIVVYTDRPTNYSLCLVSSSVRAITSPQLYKSMTVWNPDHLDRLVPKKSLARHESSLLPSDPSLTLNNVTSLEMVDYQGHFGWAADKGPVTYKPAPLPNLRHLHLSFDYIDLAKSDSEDQARNPRTDSLSLSAVFLSHLNPYSLTFKGDSNDHWRYTEIARSTWMQATRNWNRLSNISFVDSEWLELYLEFYDNFFTHERFVSSDLPGCTQPISFSWAFTEGLGGYAGVSEYYEENEEENPLSAMVASISEFSASESSSVQDLQAAQGVLLNVGVKKKDRDTVREDLKELPKRWRRLIRY